MTKKFLLYFHIIGSVYVPMLRTSYNTYVDSTTYTFHAIGLYDGCIVSCKVIEEVPVLDVVHVSAVDQKDWEMLVSYCYIMIHFKNTFVCL